MADISKIKLPSGNEYDIKDAVAREMISGGISFIISWTATDYASTTAPTAAKLATIPEGAEVHYNNGSSSATGTLEAGTDTKAKFYLIYSKTQSGNLDTYDEYVTVESGSSYFWEKIGDTQIDLSNVVTGVSLDKQTDTVIGSDATFSITQPTIALATDSSGGTGKVQVVTDISSTTDPSVTLSAESSSATGRAQYIQSVSTTKAKATTSGTGVAWGSKDSVTALTGLGNPSVESVFSATSMGLVKSDVQVPGAVAYISSQGTASTTKISASADITGKTGSAASSVTPTTKKLATTSVTGVSGSTNITPVESRTSQTTVSGFTAATTSNYDSTNDILKGASVSNEVLILGAYKPSTQTTYSAGAPRASLAVPTAASNATTVATGSVTTSGSGADIVTDVAVGDTITVVTSAPAISLTSGSTGDVTVATGIGSATTKYMTINGTTVDAVTGYASPTTDSVIGSDATFSVTDPTTTLSTASTGDITIATGGTTKYMKATASGMGVTPSKTYIKGTASGANTAWNSKDTVTVLTNATDVDVTKGN